jgi:hypothetical protein
MHSYTTTRKRRRIPQPAPTIDMTDKFPNGPFLRPSTPQRRSVRSQRHAAGGKNRRPIFEAHVRAGRLSNTGTQLRRPQNDRSRDKRLSETCGHHSYQPRRVVTQRQDVNRFSKCEDHTGTQTYTGSASVSANFILTFNYI